LNNNGNKTKKISTLPMIELLLVGGQKRYITLSSCKRIDFSPFGLMFILKNSNTKLYPYSNIVEIIWPGELNIQPRKVIPGKF